MKNLLWTVGAVLTAFITSCTAWATDSAGQSGQYSISEGMGVPTITVKAVKYVCQIGEQKYETLTAAIEAASAGDTIQMLKDVDESVTVGAGKEVTIDLNGKVVGGDGLAPTITNTGGALVITNSTSGLGSVYDPHIGIAFSLQGGTTTISGGVFDHDVEIVNGELIIMGGMFAVNGTASFPFSEYLAEGYTVTEEYDYYTVTAMSNEIQCNGTENCGAVSVTVGGDATTSASAGDEVTIVATPVDGYCVSSIFVQAENQESVEVVNGVFTMPACAVAVNVTFAEGMAKLNDTWYPTFEAAYSNATVQTDTLVVKINGDFSPVLNGSRTFTTVTFTNTATSAESIAINTLYNGYTFKAYNWNFPKNATLSLSGTNTLVSAKGGVLDVKSGAVVTLNGYATLDNITGVTGAGDIKTSSGNDSSSVRCYAINTLADYTGTLNVVANSRLSIASVDLDAAPAEGVVVIPATVSGTLDGDLAVKVNGTANGQTLVYDSAKGGLVLYVASGYDSGDGTTAFSIDSTVEATLIEALPTGKTSLADTVEGTSLTYAQAYALGLWDGTGAVADFNATITVVNGQVAVALANKPATGYTITTKIYAKDSLTANWPTEPSSSATFNVGTVGFYKVEVVIANTPAN